MYQCRQFTSPFLVRNWYWPIPVPPKLTVFFLGNLTFRATSTKPNYLIMTEPASSAETMPTQLVLSDFLVPASEQFLSVIIAGQWWPCITNQFHIASSFSQLRNSCPFSLSLAVTGCSRQSWPWKACNHDTMIASLTIHKALLTGNGQLIHLCLVV